MLKIGYKFNIAKTACGEVYSWGNNEDGQLGLGDSDNQNIPQLVEFFKDKQIKNIKCGDSHTIAITEIGDVYSWGWNFHGPLGLGHYNYQNIPQLIDFFKDKQIRKIKCGAYHTIAITKNGEVYSWGYNLYGQLGLGHDYNQNIPQLVDFFKDKQIKEIKCGAYHTFAITEIGEVYSWGCNDDGQLGLGHQTNQVIPQQVEFFKDKQINKIKCGFYHTIAITDIGEVYSWGSNGSGNLGLGNNCRQNIPQLVDFFKDKQIKKIKCGGYHTFAITEIDEVYSWGSNNSGQLGLGHNSYQNIPQLVDFFKDKQIKKIKCGYKHTIAITENGDVYSWGNNLYGLLGLGNNYDQNIPQLVEFFKEHQIFTRISKIKSAKSASFYS